MKTLTKILVFFLFAGIGYAGSLTSYQNALTRVVHWTLTGPGDPGINDTVFVHFYSGPNAEGYLSTGATYFNGDYGVQVGEVALSESIRSIKVGLNKWNGSTLVSGEAGITYNYEAEDEPTNKVRLHYKNEQNYPVTLGLFDETSGEMVGSVVVGAGEEYTGNIEVPSGLTNLTAKVGVDDLERSGVSWVEAPGAVSYILTRPDGDEPPPINSEETAGDPEITYTIREPENMPSSTSVVPDGGSGSTVVWKPTESTVDNERLDKQTYRQGVERIVETLEGKAVSVPTVTNPSGVSATWNPNGTSVTGAIGKLPSAPTISSALANTSSVSFNIKIPKITGGSFEFVQTVNFDAAPYAAPIGVFRGIMLVVVTLGFYLASVWVVRGAFASR
jgi:hypothetical protein